jgi:hypothetical protein
VGSKTFDGVWFEAYSDDHMPPHVHGFYAGVEIIVELVDGKTRLARRKKAVIPSNAKRADVNRILRTGAMHADELFELWRVARG